MQKITIRVSQCVSYRKSIPKQAEIRWDHLRNNSPLPLATSHLCVSHCNVLWVMSPFRKINHTPQHCCHVAFFSGSCNIDNNTDLTLNTGTVTMDESDIVTWCIVCFNSLRMYKFDNLIVSSLRLYNLVVQKSMFWTVAWYCMVWMISLYNFKAPLDEMTRCVAGVFQIWFQEVG